LISASTSPCSAARCSGLNLSRPHHDDPAGDPTSFSRAEEPGLCVDPRGDQEPQGGRAIWQAQRLGQARDIRLDTRKVVMGHTLFHGPELPYKSNLFKAAVRKGGKIKCVIPSPEEFDSSAIHESVGL
jgi:hypothetical protein